MRPFSMEVHGCFSQVLKKTLSVMESEGFAVNADIDALGVPCATVRFSTFSTRPETDEQALISWEVYLPQQPTGRVMINFGKSDDGDAMSVADELALHPRMIRVASQLATEG